jgi:hypothetical protein
MRRFVALLTVLAFVGPAVACGNDSELPRAEREFRSQYFDFDSPASSYGEYNASAAALAGSALLVGATAVTLRRRGS